MKEWIKDILIAVVIALVIIQFIKPTIVKESSMEPNFNENDYLIVSKQSYKVIDPQYGDVVVFHSSLTTDSGDEKLLIKRVIGVGGDKISITGGVVYLNGEALDESYTLDGFTDTEMAEMTVPEGQLFCMGDNRAVSVDSRSPMVGCVSEDELVGRVVLKLYPFTEIGIIHRFK